MKKFTWMMFLILGAVNIIYAQDEKLAPVTTTIAITDVNIVPSPGQLIEDGTVLMKDGIIVSVGKNVAIPPGARVVKADSMYVYAGFILGMSHVGVKMPKREERPEIKDPGNPPDKLAGITPERNVLEFLTPDEGSVSEWRELGFTMAQTAPEGGMLPGKVSLILLNEQINPDAMILRSETALYSTFEGARRMYPATVIGVMSKFRELYRQAEQSKKFNQMYAEAPAGMERPYYDRTLEAFFPVLDRSVPIVYKATSVLDAQRALKLRSELGFNLILAELQQGWDIAPMVKNANTKVLLSLDFPEWKSLEEKDSTETKEKTPEDEYNEVLESRKEEFAKKYYGQAAVYQQAGVPFGFSSLEAKSKDVRENLRKMIEHGLSEDDALAALTTTPASMLNVSQFAGTIATGKMANLVISTKPYFDEESKVRYVFVEGNLHEYEVKEAKKSDEEAVVNAVGKWKYTAESPNGPVSGNIIITESSGILSGTIDSSITDQASQLNDVLLTGNSLTFSFSTNLGGDQIEIEAILTIEGDAFEGNMSADQFGSIPVEGTKEPEKK